MVRLSWDPNFKKPPDPLGGIWCVGEEDCFEDPHHRFLNHPTTQNVGQNFLTIRDREWKGWTPPILIHVVRDLSTINPWCPSDRFALFLVDIPYFCMIHAQTPDKSRSNTTLNCLNPHEFLHVSWSFLPLFSSHVLSTQSTSDQYVSDNHRRPSP